MSIPKDIEPLADQEFTGQLDVRATKPINRRQALRTLLTASAGLLAACAESVGAQRAPTKVLTEEAAAAQTQDANNSKSNPQNEAKTVESPVPTPQPAKEATATKEAPISITEIKARSLAEDKYLIEAIKASPAGRLLICPALETSSDWYQDYLNKINFPNKIPVLSILHLQTSKGDQSLALIRRSEKVFLVTGEKNDGSLINPSEVNNPKELKAIEVTHWGNKWGYQKQGIQQEIATLSADTLTLTSPFGGKGDFKLADPNLLGTMNILDHENLERKLIPLDLWQEKFGFTRQIDKAGWPEFESSDIDLPHAPLIKYTDWISGGVGNRTVTRYLQEHPELLTTATSREGIITAKIAHNNNVLQVDYGGKGTALRFPVVFTELFLSNGKMMGGNCIVEINPDNSSDGWGVINYYGWGDLSYYRYSKDGWPMPFGKTIIEKSKANSMIQPVPPDMFEYWAEQDFDALRTAAEQFCQDGIIRDIFSQAFWPSGVAAGIRYN